MSSSLPQSWLKIWLFVYPKILLGSNGCFRNIASRHQQTFQPSNCRTVAVARVLLHHVCRQHLLQRDGEERDMHQYSLVRCSGPYEGLFPRTNWVSFDRRWCSTVAQGGLDTSYHQKCSCYIFDQGWSLDQLGRRGKFFSQVPFGR